MSKFFSEKYKNLIPYIPGEQPRDKRYVKLNTNESPFPPSSLLQQINTTDFADLRLYPDPENTALAKAYADYLQVGEENIFVGNGSDEVLGFVFSAFFDLNNKVAFADITYGFYPVYCDLFGIDYSLIPLNQDFSLNKEAFCNIKCGVVIANPNAPTGIALNLSEIEEIVKSKLDRLVVVDEAYVDFGGESAVKLIKKYSNLIVCQTFSKSRSLAGARLGFAIADKELIKDIKAIKYSFNSYNVNRLTEKMGILSISDQQYFSKNCSTIIENRDYLTNMLIGMGFDVLDSKANFVMAKNDLIGGKELYLQLKSRGILVRHFGKDRIKDYIRITIGAKAEIDLLLSAIKNILEEL